MLHEAEAYRIPEWDSVGLACVGVSGARSMCVPADQETLPFVLSGCLTSSETLQLSALLQKVALMVGKEAALRISD